MATRRAPKKERDNLRYQHICGTKKIASAAPSTRRSVQFLATLYLHVLGLLILVVFSRSIFSRAIRTVFLPVFASFGHRLPAHERGQSALQRFNM
jgi:hypothetical protein